MSNIGSLRKKLVLNASMAKPRSLHKILMVTVQTHILFEKQENSLVTLFDRVIKVIRLKMSCRRFRCNPDFSDYLVVKQLSSRLCANPPLCAG